jgi:hypothetical protein
MHIATNRPIHIAQGTEFHLRGILRESFTQTIFEDMAASQVKSSHITTDGQSANLPWCQAATSDPPPIFSPYFSNYF